MAWTEIWAPGPPLVLPSCIVNVVCREFAMLFVRYALSATDLIHELNHGIKIEKKVAMEVRAQDDREEDNDDLGSVASGGLELVAIKAMDDSSAEEQYIIDNETVLFHGLIKIMPGKNDMNMHFLTKA